MTARSAFPVPSGEMPGQPPFTRGIRPAMYAEKLWTIRQYAGFSTASETNAFFRQNLAAGQTGLSVAFDLATHRGYDSDHPRATADVGMAGVAIDSVEDMKALFEGIPLDQMSVSMTMNGAVLPIMAAYIVEAEEQGVKPAALSGTLQNDILKEFLVRNTYIYPPQPSLRITADIMAYCAEHLPRFNPVSISGYHMHEAGATAAEELAFTLLNGLDYVRAAVARGLPVDSFAPRLSFFFGIGMDFFTEIAKLRAARQLWARLMQDNFNPRDPRSLMLRLHCQTSGVSLAEQDPYNNIVRTAYEALAAVLGGTQSLHTNSFDEAMALPTDFSARIARNTQLILAHEMGLTNVPDPLGGSSYLEALTSELAANATTLMNEVAEQGGMLAAIESGWAKSRIEQSAALKQAAIDTGQQVIVGVNRFQPTGQDKVPVREVNNAAVLEGQLARLAKVRSARDNKAVTAALAALTEAAKDSSQNLLAAAITAMRARATVGEVSAALEAVFTRHRAMVKTLRGVYGAARSADPNFARIKTLVTAAGAPRLLVVKLGQDGHDRGAKLIAGAFADLGFAVEAGPLFDTPAEAAARAKAANAQVVGVSTLAGAHKQLVPELMAALKAEGLGHVLVVVGGVIPAGDYAGLFATGVKAVYGPGTDLLMAAEEIIGLLSGRNEPPRSLPE